MIVIWGLAETSNASPLEFQKVLATAARTYALYHYYRGLDFGLTEASTKHANEHFHVDATYDQVYRGYNSEIRMPRLAQAVQETRGMIVTYNHELAITPYFSRSDGAPVVGMSLGRRRKAMVSLGASARGERQDFIWSWRWYECSGCFIDGSR